MDVSEHFRDITLQLQSVRNRIRRLIGGVHWPSDGAWKESVIRSVLRGYLPPSMSVGSGFVLTTDGPSSQIDIIIYDDSSPVLFRDGDLVIVTADCVRAVIEVKTRLTVPALKKALSKLNDVSVCLRHQCIHPKPFLGLFAFEAISTSDAEILEMLCDANSGPSSYPITSLSFGEGQFYRFWEFDPNQTSGQIYNHWCAYAVPGLGPGYFIHNVIEHLFPKAFERCESLWYPIQSEKNITCSRKRG